MIVVDFVVFFLVCHDLSKSIVVEFPGHRHLCTNYLMCTYTIHNFNQDYVYLYPFTFLITDLPIYQLSSFKETFSYLFPSTYYVCIDGLR